jgi:hypothetical protein
MRGQTVNGGRIPGQRGGVKAGQWGLHDDMERGLIGPLSISPALVGSGGEGSRRGIVTLSADDTLNFW